MSLLLLLLLLATPPAQGALQLEEVTWGRHAAGRGASCALANNLDRSSNEGFGLSGFFLAQHLVITDDTTVSSFEVAFNSYGRDELDWAQVWTELDGLPGQVIGGTAFDTSLPTISAGGVQGPFYAWNPFTLASGAYWLVMKPTYPDGSWVLAADVQAPSTPASGETVAMDTLAFYSAADGQWYRLERSARMRLSGCLPGPGLLAFSLDQLPWASPGADACSQTFQARVGVVVTSLTVALSSDTGRKSIIATSPHNNHNSRPPLFLGTFTDIRLVACRVCGDGAQT
jgi:hypothetical protein